MPIWLMAVVVVVYTGESVGCGAQLREMARAAAVEVTLAVAGMTVETTSDVPAAAAAPTVRGNCSGERSGSALAARFVDASQRKCGHRESVIQLQLQPAPPSKLLKTNDVRRFCGCRVVVPRRVLMLLLTTHMRARAVGQSCRYVPATLRPTPRGTATAPAGLVSALATAAATLTAATAATASTSPAATSATFTLGERDMRAAG